MLGHATSIVCRGGDLDLASDGLGDTRLNSSSSAQLSGFTVFSRTPAFSS